MFVYGISVSWFVWKCVSQVFEHKPFGCFHVISFIAFFENYDIFRDWKFKNKRFFTWRCKCLIRRGLEVFAIKVFNFKSSSCRVIKVGIFVDYHHKICVWRGVDPNSIMAEPRCF